MEPKTIAFLLPNLGGGGAERVALTITGALAERGHDVDLLVMDKRGELAELVPAGVRLVDLRAARTRNVLRPLIRYLRERRPDALQISMWPLTVIGILAARLSLVRMRVVVSDHSIPSHHVSPRSHKLLRRTIRLFYPLADARIAVSEGAASDLAELSGLGMSEFKVISNPIAFPATLVASPDVDALWGDCSNRILTMGSLKAEKNQAALIGAFAHLPKQLDCKLMICGNGPLQSELVELAEREQVADRVIFAGYASDPWPYYASADVFVLTSRQESFGNVLVEALYAGLPIVSTRTVGAENVLDRGKYGTLVEQDVPGGLTVAIHAALGRPIDRPALQARAEQLSGMRSVELYEVSLLGS